MTICKPSTYLVLASPPYFILTLTVSALSPPGIAHVRGVFVRRWLRCQLECSAVLVYTRAGGRLIVDFLVV